MPHRHTDTESERLDLRQTDSQTDRLDLKRIDAYIADIQGTDKLHLKRMNAYIADFQGTDFRGIDLLGVYIHGGNRLNATDFMVPSAQSGRELIQDPELTMKNKVFSRFSRAKIHPYAPGFVVNSLSLLSLIHI